MISRMLCSVAISGAVWSTVSDLVAYDEHLIMLQWHTSAAGILVGLLQAK